jgi:hypothetical protein
MLCGLCSIAGIVAWIGIAAAPAWRHGSLSGILSGIAPGAPIGGCDPPHPASIAAAPITSDRTSDLICVVRFELW